MTSFADPGYSPQQPGDDSRDVQVNLNADVSGYTAQVGAAQQATAGLLGAVDKLSLSLSGLTKFAGRQLFHFAAADFAGLSVAVADAANLQREMGTLRATASLTGASMGEISKGLDAAFSKFPVARSQLIQMVQTVQGAGITNPRAAQQAANTYTRAGFATGENPQQLATGGIQLGRMMGNTDTASIDKFANSLTVLHANFGVAASSILDFSQAIAPMARAAGIGQAAVMGIATAFSAAGADGAYAANTFNKMVTEIESLKETGSPDIAKYASFVGQSAGQFRSQNATQDVTQLFQQIGKGGPEALNFVSSLGMGARDRKAIQAVAQQGLLGQAINTSKNASEGGTKDLDKAAKAAMDGLTNSMTLLGNEFTKLGEIIGAPLLGPLTKTAQALGFIVNIFNKILSALGPIPGIIATLAGVVALPAAAMLTHFGVTSAVAVGRAVYRGTTATAFREGGVAGRLSRTGVAATDAMAMGPIGTRVLRDEAGIAERRAYNLGLERAAVGSAGVGARVGGLLRGGWGATMGAATWAANWSGFPKQGETRPTLRESMQTGSARGLIGAGTRVVTSTMREGTLGAINIGAAATQRLAAAVGPAGMRPLIAPAAAGASMAARAVGSIFPIAMIAGIAAPLIGSIVSSIKEANAKRADVSGSLTGAGVYDQTLNRVSTNLARFGDSVDAASDRLSKFANTPVAQLGKVTPEDINAVTSGDYKTTDPKLTSIISQAQKEAAKPGGDKSAVETAVGAYLDAQAKEGPIKGDAFVKYRQDILSNLGISQSGTVSNIMTAFGRRQGAATPTTPNFKGLGALAASTGGSDTDFQDFKNIFGAGLSGLVAGTQESGTAGTKSELTNLLSMGATATGTATAGQRDKISSFGEFLNQTFKVDPKQFAEQQKAAARQLGTTSEVMSTAMGGRVTTRAVVPYKTEADAQRVNVAAFAQTDKGKEILQTLGMSEADLLKAVQSPGALPPPEESGTVKSLRAAGPLGRFAAGDAGFVRAAVGTDSGKPGAEFAASIKLTSEAAKEAGGNFGVASSNLSGLADKIGGTTGALIRSASDWADTLNSFRLPTLTRGQQYNEALDTSRRDMAAAQAPDASDETKAKGQRSRLAFEGVQENQRQVWLGQIKEVEQFDRSRKRAEEANTTQVQRSNRDFTIQQQRAVDENNRARQHSIEDFGTSQKRAVEDYHLSVKHSEEDFNTSQIRAQEDYQRSRLRGEEDFHTSQLRAQQDYQLSSQRSTEDYQKNVSRQNEDHARDLARQAQASAQTIYDPYSRIQAKATTDAGTLIYNLKEQNKDIQKQMDDIAALKKRGLTQQSIDTLDLTNPENAQQTAALTMSLDQNPNMTATINAQVNQRVASTQRLTQSPDNMAFRNSQEDFARSMSRGSEDFSKSQRRASEDFSRSQQRASDDQSKTMKRQADDFRITTQHAASDQEKSLRRMSEAFHTQEDRAASDQKKALDRMAEAFKITQDQAVSDHAKAMGDLAKDYKKTQKQAAEDLAASLKEYSGDFVTVMGQLSTTALSALKGYAPQALAIIDQAIAQIKSKMATPLQIITAAPVGNLGPNYGIPQGPGLQLPAAPHPAAPPPAVPYLPGTATAGPRGTGFAFGGISLTAQQAMVSEHGPELHLPLNSHGEDFMASLIAKSLAQGITTAVSGGPVSSTSMSTDNSISFAGAEIQVVAQDPDQMAKQLASKAKLARLASPVRH